MGTRSITVLQDEDGQDIAVLYRHFDGYPEGHGAELLEFITGLTMVNGIPINRGGQRFVNGAEDLAAMIVAHFKEDDEPGNFYLYKAGTRGPDVGADYSYVVSVDSNGTIAVGCQDYNGAYVDLSAQIARAKMLRGTS